MKDRAFTIKEKVQNLAELAEITVHFEKARRKTDITMFTLYGERRVVLALVSSFEAIFQAEDVEILGGEDLPERYALTMVITESLTKQPFRQPERRNKLLRQARVRL